MMLKQFVRHAEVEPDWHAVDTVGLQCGACHHKYTVTAGDRYMSDTTSSCPSCDTVVAHPARANLARCPSCGLAFRVDAVPAAVGARNGLARVDFDGWTVTLTRLWCPVPRWRQRRIPLDRIVRAKYNKPLSDAATERATRFVVHVRGEDRDQELWMWIFRNVSRWRRTLRFEALATAINETVEGRKRLLIEDSVGLGPWSESQWQHIEERVPEVREIYPVDTAAT